MIVLKEIGTAQTFSFIPRSDAYTTMTITDEQTNVTTTVSIQSSTNVTYYHTITAIFSLKEEHTYRLEVLNSTTPVYIDKIYCTNQTISDYTINKDTYTSTTTSNDFIIID